MSEVAIKDPTTSRTRGGRTKTYSVPLDSTKRCDRCGAQAYHKATHPNYNTPLLFCNHHDKMHGVALEAQGFQIEDQSDRLTKNTKPDSSAAA